ncbi:MAG: phenylalanine--tRNA ligase subunit beta [Candidatus Paceibacterota bacterium]|jgi:phenylalanyl-tRNA synthetase beta chain
MKVSLKWLQTYFDAPLPSAEDIALAYTFHSFEIDEMQGDLLDVKVLPNRAADCLSHRGLAKELSAILNVPLENDPLRDPLPEHAEGHLLRVGIEDPKKCLRYMGALVRGVKVGPSPAWLKEALEAVGQRSINNVVDATNYVMLNIGQPLHAFDAAKLVQKDGVYAIGVRSAKEGEKIATLSGEEYGLSPHIQLITDAHTDTPIALAGVKGGKAAELTEETSDIIVESANFDGTTTRRAAQALKLFTDASARFQNRPSPELAAYGMRDVLALIISIAGGEVAGVTDVYPVREEVARVAVSHARINSLLGSAFTIAEIEEVFRRLGLAATVQNDVFTVTPPFERTDLVIPEDLVEEVGRIIGYDKLAPQMLPALATTADQNRFRGMERMKDQLVAQGFIEVSTQSFARKGDVVLANPLDKNMPALRTSLEANLNDALVRANYVAPLVLPPNQKPKLFEVGTVFPKEGEFVELRMTERVPAWGENFPTVDNLSVAKLEDYGRDYQPVKHELGAYQPFSVYPFVARDISMWITDSPEARGVVLKIFGKNGGGILQQVQLLDQFTNKEGRQSLAFRLIFQSFKRTLTDEEVNTLMADIASALSAEGFQVR